MTAAADAVRRGPDGPGQRRELLALFAVAAVTLLVLGLFMAVTR